MPSLSQPEARAFALSMLGKDASAEIARRAAAMGGSTPLGVVEAVRLLVASGDVVFDRDSFRWRRGPAGRVGAHSVDALLEERIDQLSAGSRRMLEILAIVPDPDDAALVSEVADAEGLRDSVRSDAVEELIAYSLLERCSARLHLSPTVRDVVLEALPPARLADLHRFVASALERRIPSEDAFVRATLAYHLGNAGRLTEAVDILLDMAVIAGQLGFLRSGVRLAATAVEFDASTDTRSRAARLAEQLNERVAVRKSKTELRAPESVSGVPSEARAEPPADDGQAQSPLSAQALQQAVEGIAARDFDAVERALELVVAAGRDGPSVDRLRSMTALVKGDRTSALHMLERARQRESENGGETPRTVLTRALVLVESGDVGSAVRETLRALALARTARDAPGEKAALTTLAACYRRLGREQDALALEGFQKRAALPPPLVGGSSGR
jgi:hypothetical protein